MDCEYLTITLGFQCLLMKQPFAQHVTWLFVVLTLRAVAVAVAVGSPGLKPSCTDFSQSRLFVHPHSSALIRRHQTPSCF